MPFSASRDHTYSLTCGLFPSLKSAASSNLFLILVFCLPLLPLRTFVIACGLQNSDYLPFSKSVDKKLVTLIVPATFIAPCLGT